MAKKKSTVVLYFAYDSKHVWGYGRTKARCLFDAKYWLHVSKGKDPTKDLARLKTIRLTGETAKDFKLYINQYSGDSAVRKLKRLMA